jgi:hypothetical protein
MATIEIWEPTCEDRDEPCSRRANRIVRDVGGNELGKFCSTHGDRRAKIQAKKETQKGEK